MDHNWPLSVRLNHLREALIRPRSMGTWAIEEAEFKSDLRCDLLGHFEATRASEAMKEAFHNNMHMDSRVIEDVGFKSEAKFIARMLTSQ